MRKFFRNKSLFLLTMQRKNFIKWLEVNREKQLQGQKISTGKKMQDFLIGINGAGLHAFASFCIRLVESEAVGQQNSIPPST